MFAHTVTSNFAAEARNAALPRARGSMSRPLRADGELQACFLAKDKQILWPSITDHLCFFVPDFDLSLGLCSCQHNPPKNAENSATACGFSGNATATSSARCFLNPTASGFLQHGKRYGGPKIRSQDVSNRRSHQWLFNPLVCP